MKTRTYQIALGSGYGRLRSALRPRLRLCCCTMGTGGPAAAAQEDPVIARGPQASAQPAPPSPCCPRQAGACTRASATVSAAAAGDRRDHGGR